MSSTIPQTSGIYRIICKANSAMYIGSSVNLRKRCQDHFSQLRNNKHPNRLLQSAYNKYGPDAFHFEVIELVLSVCLLEREQYWLDKMKPFAPHGGFNIAKSTQHTNLGIKASVETIEKSRLAHLGKTGYWTGKKRDPETNAKISAAKRGKSAPRHEGYTHSPEHREKLRLANLGKKQSEETIRKRTEKVIGKPRSAEVIEKIRIAKLGHTHSPEACEGMRVAHTFQMKTLIVVSPEGVEYEIVGIGQFCKEHFLDRSTLIRVAKGQLKHHKGWTARFP